jgi:hypothetical protein
MKVARHFSAGIGHWLTGRVPLGTTDWWHPNQPSLRDSMSHLGKFPALKCRASFIPSLTGRAECLAPILGASSNHPLCGWQLIADGSFHPLDVTHEPQFFLRGGYATKKH